MIIIYVADQARSRDFYRQILNAEPILDVPGMTEFSLNDKTTLGIMPENDIAELLGDIVPNPSRGNGIPLCEIYLYVDNPDSHFENLIKAGGKGISPAMKRSWGDFVSYGADPDGHILAFARSDSNR